MNIAIHDVNPKDREYVNQLIIQSLRDSIFVLEQTRLIHWGINGPKFYQIHLLTESIQNEMHVAVDTIAEHARSVNLMTPLAVDNLLSTRLNDVDMSDPYDEEKVILEYSVVHDMLASFFEELAKYAGMIGDDLTQGLAVDRARKHKTYQWHLRSSLTYKISEENVKESES
tara:strand:- start:8415 stop:8927 length:513 start_codon:yes stop_codon:yes gene_type:complete